jgi:hypothetical protein
MDVVIAKTEESPVYDIGYLTLGCLFLAACWFFTKVCEKL